MTVWTQEPRTYIISIQFVHEVHLEFIIKFDFITNSLQGGIFYIIPELGEGDEGEFFNLVYSCERHVIFVVVSQLHVPFRDKAIEVDLPRIFKNRGKMMMLKLLKKLDFKKLG
jgi:hypothetical protein